MLTVAAILVIVAVMALMTRGMVAPADTGGVGAQDAKAGVVGSAIVHDDAGIMHASMVKAPGNAPVHDDTGIMHASMVKDMGQMRGTGAAVIHDDAGNAR